jgi:mycothiol synthase
MSIRHVSFGDDRASIDALLGAVERFDGYVPLTEDGELDYRRGPQRPGLVATEAGRVVGYAQITGAGAVATVELAVHPECRAAQGRRLLAAALGEAGNGPVAVWASDDDMVAAAASHGLQEERAVIQLVGGLPPVEQPDWPDGIEPAPFVAGRDEPAFVELNRVAFAGHPDNAAWDMEVLAERMSRDWFDVAGIVTARRAERLVGACWTKVHPGRVGEVYWLAVHPDEQRRSIGRALALSGLWHLSERCDTATVYTESDNTRAKNLYGGLGFRLLRVKRRMVR